MRFLGGMCGGNSSVVQGYIADVTPVEYRSGRMAVLGAAYNIGFIFGPGLGGLLARPGEGPAGFQLPLLVSSGLAGLSALGIFLIVKESRVHVGHAAVQGPNRWTMTGRALTHPVVGRLMLVTFVAGLAFNGIESTFGFWATRRYHWTPADIGVCFTVAAVASALGQSLLTGALSRRYGQAAMLAFGIMVTVLCLVLQPFSPVGVITIGIMAVMSLGQSVAFPNTSALISRSSDENRQGQMLGL